ncbi:MAG TPA: ParA family protein [Xanthobacteraceae bacterium]|jgi:chromosome partitioning protein
MFTVAVIAQKGGVGKTTLTLHLAVAATAHGPVSIIDMDPQSSAAQWADERRQLQPVVIACPPARLAMSLQTARRNGARITFIDTAPAVESPALAAVRAADFCLIVSRPGILDLRSIGINVEIARLAGKPVALVINAAPSQGGHATVASEEAHARYGVEVCPIVVRQRAILGHALIESRCAQEVEPASKAAAEIAALWDWLGRRAMPPITAPELERLSA